MKVKVLASNLMVDYKKIELGDVIELSKNLAGRFVKAGLVETIAEPKKATKE